MHNLLCRGQIFEIFFCFTKVWGMKACHTNCVIVLNTTYVKGNEPLALIIAWQDKVQENNLYIFKQWIGVTVAQVKNSWLAFKKFLVSRFMLQQTDVSLGKGLSINLCIGVWIQMRLSCWLGNITRKALRSVHYQYLPGFLFFSLLIRLIIAIVFCYVEIYLFFTLKCALISDNSLAKPKL